MVQFFLLDDVPNKLKPKLLTERALITILKSSCLQSIVDLIIKYLQLCGTKKQISLFVETFPTASPFRRINYWWLSESSPEPSEL